MSVRVYLLRLALAAAALICVPAQAGSGATGVYKVRATTGGGERVEGSAVSVARGLLVTNCHVVRDAGRIEVARGVGSWAAEIRGGDPERDLCMLAAPGIGTAVVEEAESGTLSAGDTVYAIGFPAGSDEPHVSRGRVESLYAFQGGRVIQTSAAFTPGSSGGALLDAAGRLVGVLTFRAPGGGRFHFAVPAEWIAPVRAAAMPGGAHAYGRAFWERSPGELPHFLRAAWFEAKRRWPELLDECRRWAAREPGSEEPRQLMERAVERMLGAARTAAPETVSRAASAGY